LGTEVEFHHYRDLGHGFGPGIGTAAEGWLDRAVRFWEKAISSNEQVTGMWPRIEGSKCERL